MEDWNRTIDTLLAELNREEMSKHVGGIIFISLLMIIGLIGNSHVLVVFGMKMKPSNHRTFICCLGVIDLIICCTGMPFVIVDLTHPLTFYMIPICKILRCANYFTSVFSVLIMLVISIDRYRKVCQPLGWQLSHGNAKAACGVVALLSAGLSWPTLILFGHSTLETRYTNVTGVRCATDDKYINSRYQTIFNSALIFIVMGAFVVHIVLYSLISRVIRNHNLRKLEIKPIKSLKQDSTMERTVSVTNISVVSEPDSSPQLTTKTGDKQATSIKRAGSSNGAQVTKESRKSSMHVKKHDKKFRETRRMTIIFFAVIAIFFISYIPHLSLRIIQYSNSDFLKNLSEPALLLYNTFIWCFFINNVANPIVYMFLDIKFRAEVMSFYRHLSHG